MQLTQQNIEGFVLKVRNLLQKGDIKEAIDTMTAFDSNFKLEMNDATRLSARFYQLERLEKKGTESFENIQKERQRILDAALHLLKEIEQHSIGKLASQSRVPSESDKKNHLAEQGEITTETTTDNACDLFIRGANNGITVNYDQASDGTIYILVFPSTIIAPVKLHLFFNQLDFDLRAVYADGVSVELPYKFDFGYDRTDSEISWPKTSNYYFIGQYDFDGDNIDEIIFAVQDFDNGLKNISVSIIKYFPPSNEKYSYRTENWELFHSFSAGSLFSFGGQIEDKSIRFDRGLRDFFYEWSFVRGKFLDTGNA